MLRSPSFKSSISPAASAWTNMRKRLYIRMSKLKLRNTARASPSWISQISSDILCSFCWMICVPPYTNWRSISGGNTYGIGVRPPFSSRFTAFTLNEVSSSSSIGTLSRMSSKENGNRRHSPRTSSKRANRITIGSSKSRTNILRNRMERKSVIPPTFFSGSKTGILNWTQRVGRDKPFGKSWLFVS